MPLGPVQKVDAVRQQASQAIANASRQTGMSFDYLMAQARIESSLNPNAKAATSTAAGLFQFTKQTWLATLAEHGPAHGLGWASQAISQSRDGNYRVADPGLRQQIMNLRYDADASSLMAARFADDNADTLRTGLGREPEPVDLYLAHFLGAKGATSFLRAWQQDPGQPAAPLFPKAAAANRAIFFGRNGSPASLDEIRSNFAAKMGKGAIAAPGPYGGGAPASAGITSYGSRSSAPSFANARPESAEAFLRRAAIEPMPGKLSMAYAARTYQRLNASAGA